MPCRRSCCTDAGSELVMSIRRTSAYLGVILVIGIEHIPLTGAATMIRYGVLDANKHNECKLCG